ncbi:unnamed protein product [Orchesella dallaii]|uniref:Ceramide transfer protein n=1 Tax=Orchesella dallaii TaxID=48710 RepID=A0ABP1Q6L4_9HEXA
MSQNPSPTLTDEDDGMILDNSNARGVTNGVLSKWTNYIHGWQDRYIVLREGTLSYYKSEFDLSFGCRGSISILKANIKPHEFDECRFDVSLNDCVWYLRATNAEEKSKWVEVLEVSKRESGYGSQNSLRRHGSAVSIASTTQSVASASSFHRGRSLNAKLSELENYRGILVQQIDTLQKYFDLLATATNGRICDFEVPSNIFDSASSNVNRSNSIEDVDTPTPTAYEDTVESPFFRQPEKFDTTSLNHALTQSGLKIVDFRGEALTFKATTAAIVNSVSNCIEFMQQREDLWKKRHEREVEKRKKLEENFNQALKEAQEKKAAMGGPDCEEGPHSTLKDDEFYDAVELGLEKLEEEAAFKERLKTIILLNSTKSENHPLWTEIDRVTLEQLHYAKLGVGEGGWDIFAEEGEMRMYKREQEIDGRVVDPLKAVHTVKGVTGHEMCHYFFNPDVRMEWETTLEQMTILESVSEDTLVFLQIHKRVWPAAQRDALFWSHIRSVPDARDSDGPRTWIVCNHSTDHDKAPECKNGKYIRVDLTVCMVCQTIVEPPKNGAEVTRDNLTCKVTYCSEINPGGWAPAAALRAVYKREYPKFLKKFTHYVYEQCKNKPILF